MNENQSITKNYILIVKTIYGDPGDNIVVIIKGTDGQTEKLSLGKSQSHSIAFKENQTDVFVMTSNIRIGNILQIEFNANLNTKFKEWKYNNIHIIDGTRVYRDMISTYHLLSSIDNRSVTNVAEPVTNFQECIYYAFIKTGHDSCSKECNPKLSLFGQNQQHTEIDLKSLSHLHSSSINNNIALEKNQLDIFQWSDRNIGNMERIHLQLYSEIKHSKYQWPIDWMFVIHHGYSFTGRIMMNRIVKIDRLISINLEQRTPPMTGEYGDSSIIQKIYNDGLSSLNNLNKQSNASKDDIGRYYVIIRNLEGTNGNVYIDFHGDRSSSAGEQHLSKCENYPDQPFTSKHTDLYHVKAIEVGHIQSVTLRLDQTEREHSLTLDSLYVIHNAIVYQFDLKYIILNKQQPNKEFVPLSHPTVADGEVCYYIATHTADRMLSTTNASFHIVITGTKGILGPMELKESLTNGDNPFEKECIDLFRIQDKDVGDPISMTIILEPKGLMPHIFSSATIERIMIIKDGEYNSLWQLIGDLKSKEAKTIPLPPLHQSQSMQTPMIPAESLYLKMADKSTPLKTTTDQIHSYETKSHEHIEKKPIIIDTQTSLSNDYHQHGLIMAEIENHQKQHTFAPSLQQAQQNYRELRRLLKKMNGPIANENKIQIDRKQSRQNTGRIS